MGDLRGGRKGPGLLGIGGSRLGVMGTWHFMVLFCLLSRWFKIFYEESLKRKAYWVFTYQVLIRFLKRRGTEKMAERDFCCQCWFVLTPYLPFSECFSVSSSNFFI